MQILTRPKNLLANVGHQISKKSYEISAVKYFASDFANEIARIPFSLFKVLANGRLRQKSLAIVNATAWSPWCTQVGTPCQVAFPGWIKKEDDLILPMISRRVVICHCPKWKKYTYIAIYICMYVCMYVCICIYWGFGAQQALVSVVHVIAAPECESSVRVCFHPQVFLICCL